MQRPVFSYPANDEDMYLSSYRNDFSSVFVGMNSFLRIPDVAQNVPGEWIPDKAVELAKILGTKTGVSWSEIAKLCDFPSVAHVNRALCLTGSKRIKQELPSPSDTNKGRT